MRTNIDIDEELIAEVMRATGAKTKKQAVEESLRDRLRRRDAAEAIIALQGKVEWVGDLDEIRRDR